jgi:hypothetical protein
MEPGIKLITLRRIKRMEHCKDMTRQFVQYLRVLGVVTGTKVKIIQREVWKYSPAEVAVIQSVWYFRKKGFDLPKSIEFAKKSEKRRDLKAMEPQLFSDTAS